MTEETQNTQEHSEHTPAHGEHNDELTLFGQTMPIYTWVLIALGVLTLIEVLIGNNSETLGVFGRVSLLVLAFAKAALVVLFYMHLRTDSRIFAVVLLLPLIVSVLSVLFLVTVPAGY